MDGKQLYIWISKKEHSRGAQLAQSEGRVTLDLGEVSSNPTLGVEMTFKKERRKEKEHSKN